VIVTVFNSTDLDNDVRHPVSVIVDGVLCPETLDKVAVFSSRIRPRQEGVNHEAGEGLGVGLPARSAVVLVGDALPLRLETPLAVFGDGVERRRMRPSAGWSSVAGFVAFLPPTMVCGLK
jgi:hypothetical protein